MGTDLSSQLVKHLEEAHAMEQSVLRMLDGMIGRADDAEFRRQLEHHKEETQRHIARVEERLAAYGESPSKIKDYGGMLGVLMKSVVDIARGDKPGRDARDGFAAEYMEIASYELLERMATKAGDEATAEVARENRADEEAMASKIAASWDSVIDQTLREEQLV
jgi:ferritin-like metal-binding protein YciE